MSDKFGMPEVDCRPTFEIITELREQLAAMTAERDALNKLLDKISKWEGGGIEVDVSVWRRINVERDEYRKALEICKTEMQGDKWDALYIDTVLAKYSEDAIE